MMDGDNDKLHGRHRLPEFDYASGDHAYFVTARARFGSPFTDARLAQVVVDALGWMRERRDVRIYTYCLMPDHLHVLLQLPAPSTQLERIHRHVPRPAANRDPHAALGTIVGNFKSFTTHESWALGFRGQLWQSRFYDHIVRRSEDGHRIGQYILENPVRKDLVADWAEWPWSGMPDPL